MQRLLKIQNVDQPRTFEATGNNGQKQQVTVVGLVLTNGMDTFFAEAFRDVADKVKGLALETDDLVSVKLGCKADKRTTEKGEFYSNKLTILAIDVMLKAHPAF